MNDNNVIFNKDDQVPQDASVPPVANEESGVVEVPPVEGASTFAPQQAQQQQNLNLDSTGSEQVAQVQEGGEFDPPDDPPSRTGGGKLKKIIIGIVILILIVVAAIVFWPKGIADEEASLVWWGLWEDQAVVAPIIEEFEKENPKITVEYIKQDPKQYGEKLQTRIKNGTGPDVFRYHNTWVPMLSSELSPLPVDVITPDEFKKSYYPVMQQDLSRNGAIYGIPIGSDSLVLFINKKLFEAAGENPPKTWEEFIGTARALTVKDGGKINTAGAALGTYGNITHAPDIISLLFLQQGVDINNFHNSDVDDKSAALSFYTSFAKGGQSVWDSTLDDSIVLFSRGNLAMYIGFSWDIFRMKSLNPEIEFETHPVPQLVGRKVGLSSYWVEGVSSKSKSQNAAFLFLKHLAKKETAEKFYAEASKTREFGELYARIDLGKSLVENEILAPFILELPNAKSSLFASDTNDGEGGINSLANIYLGNAINAIINDNSSVQTVIETLDKGVIQTYDKYGVK